MSKGKALAKISDHEKEKALAKVGFAENATLDQVAKMLRAELGEIEGSFNKRLRPWAERAAVLQYVFGLTQQEIATRLGRSQPYISKILAWRAEGYPDTAFGPQAKQARIARNYKATNNPAALPPAAERVRLGNEQPLDVSGLNKAAQEQVRNAPEDAKPNGGRDPGTAVTVDMDAQQPPDQSAVKQQAAPTEKEQEAPETTAQRSKRLLNAGSSWLDDYLPDMLDGDKAALLRIFRAHPQMRGVNLKAA